MSAMKQRLSIDIPLGTYNWARWQMTDDWMPEDGESESSRPDAGEWSREDVYAFVDERLQGALDVMVGDFREAAAKAQAEARKEELRRMLDLVKEHQDELALLEADG